MTRDELIEKMARDIHASRDGVRDYAKYRGDHRIAKAYRGDATAALSTLCASIPGLSDVIEGKAVIVPVDPTEAVKTAVQWGTVLPGATGSSMNAEIYRTLISVAHYRKDAK